MEYGLQMYSVRDVANDDLIGTIGKIGSIGYKLLEFAGFFGNSAETVKKAMDGAGVRACSTHTGIKLVDEDFDGVVAYHKTIGCEYLIEPGTDLSSQDRIDAFIEKVNYYQPLLEQEGITLGYHNHFQEFLPNPDGSLIYENILNRTSMKLEIDTFWVFNAGQDPLKMMEDLKDRLIFVHIKDGMEDGKGTPLGRGKAPVAAVYKKARAMGIPMIVESESFTPDGPTEAKICYEYLRSQE